MQYKDPTIVTEFNSLVQGAVIHPKPYITEKRVDLFRAFLAQELSKDQLRHESIADTNLSVVSSLIDSNNSDQVLEFLSYVLDREDGSDLVTRFLLLFADSNACIAHKLKNKVSAEKFVALISKLDMSDQKSVLDVTDPHNCSIHQCLSVPSASAFHKGVRELLQAHGGPLPPFYTTAPDSKPA